jgi:hypothetical protein
MPGRAISPPSGGTATQSATEPRADAAPSPWTALEDHLESARRSILAEIRNYPPPIAACDQQFNYLLEQRDRVARELSRLASIRRDNSRDTDVEPLLEFINASECIGGELKAHLVQLLHQRLGEPT